MNNKIKYFYYEKYNKNTKMSFFIQFDGEDQEHEKDASNEIMQLSKIFIRDEEDNSTIKLQMTHGTYEQINELCAYVISSELEQQIINIPKHVHVEYFLESNAASNELKEFYNQLYLMQLEDIVTLATASEFLNIQCLVELFSIIIAFKIEENLDETNFTAEELKQTLEENKWIHEYA